MTKLKRELAAELSQEDLIQLMAWLWVRCWPRKITLAEEVASTEKVTPNMAS